MPQMQSTRKNRQYRNLPQVVFNLVRAAITLCFWGRGTGKTEGPGGDFTLNNILSMPRSLGGLVSVSYDKLYVFILPKLIKAWEKLGYKENVHFWVGKYAPEHLKIEKPHLAPQNPKRFIHWFNGAGIQLISLDRMGISNAADVDWLYADECKLFEEEKFTEVLHTNRGNKEFFGHLPNHHSVLLTTDRPQSAKGNWLYTLAEKHDQEKIDVILMIQQHIFDLKDKITRTRTKTAANKILKEIDQYNGYLNQLRKGLVFVSEASTLDNIEVLGYEQIRQLQDSLTDTVYRISVLNQRMTEVENGFYPLLSSARHGYDAVNFSFVERLEHNFTGDIKANCLWYTDRKATQSLDIAMDHNAAINNIATGQMIDREYKLIHTDYTHSTYKTLMINWDKFFADHPTKVVNYYYDHTMVAGRPDNKLSIQEEITGILRSLGWIVNPIYIGQQPSHKSRFILWEILCQKGNKYADLTFNRSTCQYWYERAKMTRTKITQQGVAKDKSDEKKPNFPQEEAPHITDAVDTLVVGAILQRQGASLDTFDLST